MSYAVFSGTSKHTEQEIKTCLEDELKSFNNAHYDLLKHPLKPGASHGTTEYFVKFDDKKGVFRFLIDSYESYRVLGLIYPEVLERKQRFLNYIIQKCC